MKSTMKRWVSLGLSTALLGGGLVACGGSENSAADDARADAHQPSVSGELGEGGEGERGEHGEKGEGESGEGESGEGEAGEGDHNVGALPLPKRLAFMTGHVKAGLALYRAGEPQMAAPHLLHPVSETHQAERAGLDALGFDGALFEAVSKALEEGRPAEDIEPQLAAAEKNLADIAEKAGGDDADIIRYLMDVIVEEYSIAITDGAVSDPGEYQDAYGFALVARERAERLNPTASDLIAELDALIALWPSAPIPNENPSPIGQVIAQTSKIALLLPAE